MLVLRNEQGIRSLLQERGVRYFVFRKDHRHIGVPLISRAEALQDLLTTQVREVPGFEKSDVLMFREGERMFVQFARSDDWNNEVLEAVVNDAGVVWQRYLNGSPIATPTETDDARLMRVVETAQDLADAQTEGNREEKVLPPNLPEELLALPHARLTAEFYQRMVAGRRLVVVSDLGGRAPVRPDGSSTGTLFESALGPVMRFFRYNTAHIIAHPTGHVQIQCAAVRAERGPDGLNRLRHKPMGEPWEGPAHMAPRTFRAAAEAAVDAAARAVASGPPTYQVTWGQDGEELVDAT